MVIEKYQRLKILDLVIKRRIEKMGNEEKQIENKETVSNLNSKEFSNISVMIIDDNKLFRKFMNKLIEINFGAKIIEVEHPKEAFEFLKSGKPDLMLLDMEMPYMDGFTFLKLLRRSDFTKNIPVVPITAITSKELIMNLSKYKIEDFIIKSAEPEVMIQKIKKVLEDINKNTEK